MLVELIPFAVFQPSMWGETTFETFTDKQKI
jgi:hypothetical protein